MLNLSRTSLLNLSATQQEEQVSEAFHELVPSTFTALTHPNAIEITRQRLVPGNSDDERAFNAFQVVRLTRSSELEAYLQLVRDILTFNPKSEKHFSAELTFPLVGIDAALNRVTDSDPFSRAVKSSLEKEAFRGLAAIRRSAQTPVLRVGAVALMFIMYTANVLGELK